MSTARGQTQLGLSRVCVRARDCFLCENVRFRKFPTQLQLDDFSHSNIFTLRGRQLAAVAAGMGLHIRFKLRLRRQIHARERVKIKKIKNDLSVESNRSNNDDEG